MKKQNIKCFQAALPTFLKEQELYKSNRKQGKRPTKNKGGKNGSIS